MAIVLLYYVKEGMICSTRACYTVPRRGEFL